MRDGVRLMSWAGLVAAAVVAAQALAAGDRVPSSPLAGTAWRLIEFQSMDDAQGITRPGAGTLYTMRLHGDGTVAMQLNCNRATGTWSAEPGTTTASGRLTFGPLAATRALCPPPTMDESIVAQAGYISSYLLKDGRLYLNLMADGGLMAAHPVGIAVNWPKNDRPAIVKVVPLVASQVRTPPHRS